MKIENCIQGSADWFDVRAGRVTASNVWKVMDYLNQTEAEKKAGIRRESAQRANYRAELIAGILTGQAQEHYVSDAMLWGQAQETLAATEYELQTDADVSAVGFVYHPSIDRAGASPDRLVGKDGLLEIKNPNTTTHLKWLLAGVVPEEHKPQMYFQMRCTERDWCDFMSFDSRLEPRYQKFIVRLHADEAAMDAIDAEVIKFLAEVDAVIEQLKERCPEIVRQPQEVEYGLTEEDLAQF